MNFEDMDIDQRLDYVYHLNLKAAYAAIELGEDMLSVLSELDMESLEELTEAMEEEGLL
jgi:hypothetical protein